MKLLYLILIKLSILFTASCGCEGYGYEPATLKPAYKSILILEDTLDDIKSISYNNSFPITPTNSKITPISITQYEPEIIMVSTLKNNYTFRVKTNANYEYFEDKNCDEGNLKITYQNPSIDNIIGGEITLKRATYIDRNSGLTTFVVDTLKLKKL